MVAQHNQLRAYTIKDGLPQSQITDLVTDDLGYLWVATQGGGLCRFDGVEFQVWNHRQGLVSNVVNAVSFMHNQLFVATNKGLSVKKEKVFANIDGPNIHEIFEFDSELYFATAKGLFAYKKEQIERYSLHAEIDESRINDVIFDGKFYWIATNKGLWRLDSLSETGKGAQKITTNNFVALTQANSYIYAATYDDGTLVFDPNGNHHDPILIREPLRITDMALVDDNELWIATDNNGITIVDTQTYDEKGHIDDGNGLQAGNVHKIITGVHDATWVTTLGGGFYKYFQNNFTHYDRDTGLRGNRVAALNTSKNGVWVATEGAKLSFIDEKGIHDISVPPYFYETKIKTLTTDDQDRLWAGTDSRGILLHGLEKVYEVKKDSTYVDSIVGYQVRVDSLVKEVIKNYIIDRSKGLLSDRVRVLEAGDDNSIWAATYAKGITNFKYDIVKDTVVTLQNYGQKEGLSKGSIHAMKIDSIGRVWYGTQSGELGYVHNTTVKSFGAVTPQNLPIQALCFYKDRVYLGTAGAGIWSAPLEDPTALELLKERSNTYSTIINQLLFDDQGVLWVGTERGIDKIILEEYHIIRSLKHFGKEDGFIGVETVPNAITKDHNGALWFGTNYGLTKYEPGAIMSKNTIGKLHFEDVQVGYQSLDTLTLNDWSNKEKVLQLNPEQTQLSFTYKMVDVNHPKAVQYRYRLNDDTWSPWGGANRQSFSGLRYGKHIFQVEARDFSKGDSIPIRFQFFIRTPWYKKPFTIWSAALFTLAILSIIGILYAITERQKAKIVEKEKDRLLNENKILELEQKALQLQMNPHFIFNVLNGIKAMGLSNPQKMNTTINSFAVLLRETLYNSRKEKITLAQELKTLRKYIEVEQLMTDKEFTYAITTNLEVDVEELLIPPMLVQPFVENAIRHGIRKGQDAGILQLNFYTKESYLYGEITDNGMGVFASQEAKKKTDHQSVALKVTRERLEAISGNNALTIQELKNEDQTITGTQVVFRIPLETEF